MPATMKAWALMPLLFLFQPALAAQAPPATAATARDGQHDFDFEFGTWTTQVRVRRNPLSGAPADWAEYRGTSIVRPIAGGRANVVELSVEGSAGRIEGVALRLYNPQARQWSLNYASFGNGLLTAPVYGGFDRRGRGTFYGQDLLDGRAILVRFVITMISSNEARFEQAYSADGGTTWEVNWIAIDTRIEEGSTADANTPTDLAQAIRSYHQATMRNDVATLSMLVTDDYRLINSDTTVQDKSSYLADFRVPGFQIDRYEVEEPFERVSGDSALTGGLFTLGWTQDGRHQSRRLRFVHAWTRQDGHWRIAYTQLTRVPEPRD